MFKTKICAGTFLLLFFLGKQPAAYGHGIIIAHENKQVTLFNSDSAAVIAFADTLMQQYDKVILHLGNSFVFRRGNIFTSPKSKSNLTLFSNILKSKKVPLTLWFFDSFGKDSFEKLYANYREMCDENLRILDSLQLTYEGIVIDVEWINHEHGDNHSKFEELIGYLRQKINKEVNLHYFASLHDTKKENMRRGYHTDLLKRYAKSPVAMLYPSDSGFRLNGQQIRPNLNDKRIRSLTQFFEKERWEVAISLESKWICQLRHDQSEMEIMISPPKDIAQNLSLDQILEEGIWETDCFTVTNPILVDLEKGRKLMLNPGDKLFNFKIIRRQLPPGCFIWEYYHLQNNYQTKE